MGAHDVIYLSFWDVILSHPLNIILMSTPAAPNEKWVAENLTVIYIYHSIYIDKEVAI